MIYSLEQRQQQKQKLTQEQQFFMEMLKMNKEELAGYLEEEFQNNPLLDFDRRTFWKEGSSFEHEGEWMNQLEAQESLQEHLHKQIGLLTEKVPLPIAEFYIYSLDKNGYLKVDLDELCTTFPNYTKEMLDHFRCVMQQMEPTGIFARNLQECLLLQLEESDSCFKNIAMQIARKCLGLMGENKVQEIAKICGCTIENVKSGMQLIRTLQPRPASGFSTNAAYTQCEIGVTIEEGNINIKMLNNYEAIQLRPEYYLIEDENMQEFVKPYLKKIRLLMDTLNARDRTLFSIVSSIVEKQSAYFLEHAYLNPLTLRDVAEQMGTNESTISRAISNKSLLFKNRLFPLKCFFVSKTQEGESRDNISGKIKEIIEKEDKKKPLSDQKIADILEQEGMKVPRRTIAKYREKAGILPAAGRREY